MILDFEKYVIKGNEFLHHLEANLGTEDRAHAARILRSTFHVLRNHLSIEESLQLVAQLPMAIKSVFVDGWNIKDHYRINTTEDFIIEIIEAEGKAAWRDFSSPDEIIESVRAVIETLRLYVSEQEIEQALNTLPQRVRKNLISLDKQEEAY